MEYLTGIINKAAEQLGGKKQLADYLEMPANNLSDVLGNRRGLTPYAQEKLEELMQLPHGSMRPASEIITEKKPERVEFWKKKLAQMEKLAACILVAIVTTAMTPAPSKAAPMLKASPEHCILCKIA